MINPFKWLRAKFSKPKVGHMVWPDIYDDFSVQEFRVPARPWHEDEAPPAPAQFDMQAAIDEARATLAASPNLSPKARQMLCDMTWTPAHEIKKDV